GGAVDMSSAATAAVAILAALRERERTGRGQYIDLAQYEVTVNLIGEAILEQSVNGRTMRRLGNRDPNRAPQGIYRCTGREAWVAISVGSDTDWQAFCRALARPDLAADPSLDTLAG